MAKDKGKGKSKAPAAGKKRVRTRRSARSNGAYSKQASYAQLLVHPDNGILPEGGVYDGELGNFRRFVASYSLGAAGHTCGIFAFCPATGNLFQFTNADPAATPAWSYTNAGAPGAAYLNVNAAKTRGVAAKVELIPSSASFSNLTGEASVGVTTANSFGSTVSSINGIFDTAKSYAPLERKAVAARWFPSGLDHTYTSYNVAPDEDRNMVFAAFRGWPAGLLMTVRVTYVVEYTVRPLIGVPPTGVVSTPVGHHAVISALQRSDPHWHHTLLDEAKAAGSGIARDVGLFARGMARAGLSTLGSAMLKQAPKALPMLLA